MLAEIEDAIAGNAVATMVWSTIARNIGSMIEGKTVRNRFGPLGTAACRSIAARFSSVFWLTTIPEGERRTARRFRVGRL